MEKTRLPQIIISAWLTLFLCGCGFVPSDYLSSNSLGSEDDSLNGSSDSGDSSSSSQQSLSSESSIDTSDAISVVFSGTSEAVIANPNGYISVSGAYVIITGAGTYEFSGTAANMQIQVAASDTDVVNLVFSGVTLSSTKNSPVYIKNADKTNIILTEGTLNTFSDAPNYVYEDAANEEPNACICSKDDLNIRGPGTLIVTGNFNNGIHSSNDLRIKGDLSSYPTIIASAVNNALKGKDSVQIEYADITLTTTYGDGIQADTEDEAGKGYVLVSGGLLDITSGRDGIQAYRYLQIDGGTISIKTGTGAPSSASGTDLVESYKGLKSDLDVFVNGGTISINAQDDGIHSGGSVSISGGTTSIATGDDGLHAEKTAQVSGGTLDITKSYEGIEGLSVDISGGNTHVVSSDDGVNAAGTGTPVLNISEGYLYVNAAGDGLDSNGNINISGGVTLINGPTSNNNSPLDYGDMNCHFSMTGGTLIAVGSSGMAVGPTAGSQYSILARHSNGVASDNLYVITDSSGTPILAFKPAKTSYSICASSSNFGVGSYKLYSSGTYSNPISTTDGYYVGGTYSGGTQIASWSFSSSNVHATIGSSSGGGGRP